MAATVCAAAARAEITVRPDAQGDAFRVVSANIRALKGTSEDTNDPNDPDSWHGKRDAICLEVLLAQKAHIYAFQEFRKGSTAETDQLAFLMDGMPGFAFFTLKNAYWGNIIFYSTERFELLGGDGFWLSETPMVDNSMSWQASANRFVNWVTLRDKKTSRSFMIWNTHLDAQTKYPRERQVQLIVDSAALQLDSVPQLLTGDLNAYYGEAASSLDTPGVDDISTINRVLNGGWKDTYEAVNPGSFNPQKTGHSFAGSPTGGGKIDWVFIRGPFKTVRAEIIKDYKVINERTHYPSDHYFVSADVEFDTTKTITAPVMTSLKYGEFSEPVGLTMDTAGNLYVADEHQSVIKRVAAGAGGAARPELVAGAGASGFRDDTRGSLALFNHPRSLAIQDGFIYVADSNNKMIRVVELSTTAVARYAGALSHGPSVAADGDLDSARFVLPAGVVIAPDGSIYIADAHAHAIRKIATNGTVSTLAGTLGNRGSANGTGSLASFNEPLGLALDASGQNLYVADAGNHTIRKIELSSATVTTIAGLAGSQGWTDGTGAAARFDTPSALAVVGGTVYVADTANHLIRAVDLATGAVTRVAGRPQKETPVGFATVIDGSPDNVLFSYPSGIVADGAGNLYIADTGNGTIRYLNLSAGATTTTPLAVSGTESWPEYVGETNPGGNTATGPTGPSHGGGGALSHWALLALAILSALRLKNNRIR